MARPTPPVAPTAAASQTNGATQEVQSQKPLVVLAKNAYVIAVLAPLSLVLFTYERALGPLYGSGPTKEHMNKFVIVGALLAAVNPVHLKPWLNWLLVALALTAAPNATYWAAVLTGREHHAVLGVLKTHAYVLLPLVIIMSSPVMRALDETTPQTGLPNQQTSKNAPFAYRATRTIIIFFVANGLARDFWANLGYLRQLPENQIYLGLAALYYAFFIATVPAFSLSALASVFASKPKKAKKLGPKRKDAAIPTPAKAKEESAKASSPAFSFAQRAIAAAAFTGIWAFAYRFFRNPVLPHPLPQPYNHPTENLRILSAMDSVTGVITVAEWLPPKVKGDKKDENVMHSARYLRASHSILGGVWTHEKVVAMPGEKPLVDSFGTPLGDSIYSAFTLQEAVRLVNSTPKGKKNKYDNALVIGLGTGTSTGALIRHGINTTILEIDPAVYDAAKTYFGLPDAGEGNVFLEDAREWVGNRRRAIESGAKLPLYDIVVHDCFSGGGVPQDLFTKQFWNNLKTTVDPEGIVAVNFAGIVESESSALIYNTLLDSFAQCRGFHDMFGEFEKEKYKTEFINIVLFCTDSKAPLTFRKGKTSDYLGSYLRQHILSLLDARELDLSSLRDETEGGHVITDGNNPLGALQDKHASHHWEVMREVLPDFHWETY